MTKKDYILIADIIKRLHIKLIDGSLGKLESFDVVKWLSDEFAYKLENDNQKFNEKKWLNYINN